MATYSHSLNRVVLKSVENGETVRSLILQPDTMRKIEVMFSVDYRAVLICCRRSNNVIINLWRPYLDNTDEDSLTTLWEATLREEQISEPKIIVSHDKTMIAILNTTIFNKGWLLSIDNNYSCIVQEFNIRLRDKLVQFIPDDECIMYASKNGLKYWSVAERKFMDKEYVFYSRIVTNNHLVMNCSPNNRQLIFKEEEDCLYMKSIF